MSFEICIGNYGYYNEGELRDKWVELPIAPSAFHAWLKGNGLWDEAHEEIYISDYDGAPFGCSKAFHENASIHELNLLARQMEDMGEGEAEKVEAWCGYVEDPSSIRELMNLIEQVEDLPIYGYSFDFAWSEDEWGQLWVDRQTPEENLGWQFLQENAALSAALAADSYASSAFDVESYGSMIADGGITPCQRFYIDNCADGPDLDRFDLAYFEDRYGWARAEGAAA